MAAKDTLIQLLDDSHQRVAQMVNQVDRNLEIYPGWTMREVLAHFNGWDEAVVTSLKAHAAGQVPTVVADGDHNAYNADTMDARADLSFEHIYQVWQNTHEQLKIVILEMPPEKLEEKFIFPWGQTGNIEDLVIGLTTQHEVSHMKDIEKRLGKQDR